MMITLNGGDKMKIYESLTSDTFFIASEASSTGWLTYDGEYLDEWKPFFNPVTSGLCRPFTNTNLKKYKKIRKLINDLK